MRTTDWHNKRHDRARAAIMDVRDARGYIGIQDIMNALRELTDEELALNHASELSDLLVDLRVEELLSLLNEVGELLSRRIRDSVETTRHMVKDRLQMLDLSRTDSVAQLRRNQSGIP